MQSFENKVVWITGASSGIGEALVYAFAKQGALLVLSARRAEELERVKNNCERNKNKILVLPFDLKDTSHIQTLTQKIIDRFGKIDVLVNNGGLSQRSYAADTPIDIDRYIMEVNYFSAVAITKSVLPFMLKQQSGHIVAISSISGKFGFFLRSAYAASKHALHGFFESLRLEVSKNNIDITIVCPGKIQTNISLNALTASGDKHNKMDKSQANGVTAAVCAQKIIEGIKANKVEVFIGGAEMRAVWIKRFFPKLFFKLIAKQKEE